MLYRKDILKFLKENDCLEVDEVVKLFIQNRHSDEIYYLISDLDRKSIENLIYRLANERNEILGKLKPETLDEQIKLEFFVNNCKDMTSSEFENLFKK